MSKCQQTTIAFMVLISLISFSTHSYAASKDAYHGIFTEYLERGPATVLDLEAHGRSSTDIDKSLSDLYQGNGLQPFWIKNGKPDSRAADILAVLDDADSHGLDPESYYVNKIHKFWDGKDTASLVKLDILLTVGMMRYVADQLEGRIEPREIDPKLFAAARDAEIDWDVLKQEAFEAPDMKAFLEQQAPPFLQYRELRKKLSEYRQIASKGEWPTIPEGKTLKPDEEDQRVIIVRQRLAATGELSTKNMSSAVFDESLVEDVKRFQDRYNLNSDGVVGKQTLAVMNVSIADRIEQIIINMERYRWLKRFKDERMVVVNIAGFRALAGKPGKFDLTMRVIVGKTYHATPVFSDSIKYIEFNPFWNLPASIARNSTLPKLKKDPLYLQKNNMRIFQGWEEGAPELDSTTMDWSNISAKDMNRYHVRQDPGPNNALGTLKIMFPNKYSVYLHDTPTHSLFEQDRRAFSHGCIRMSQPAEMAAWVLGGEEKGWNLERIDEIIKSQKRQVVNLEVPVPVYILYRTAFVNQEDNTLYFYEDIYGRDKLLAKALLGSSN